MTWRETKHRSDLLAEAIHKETIEAGLCGKKWMTRVEGSPANGRAYRIALVCPKTYAHFNHPATGAGGDYLGWTRRECNLSLQRILRGVQFCNMTKKTARARYGRFNR